MCGICGFISRKCITIDQLKKMNDTMYHRGPNDSGEEIFQVGMVIISDLHRDVSPLWICPCWGISQCILMISAL